MTPWPLRMRVAVVDVGIVRVPVCQRLMPVWVRVRLTSGVVGTVHVLVVHVVDVRVGVLQRLVGVPMDVALGEMEPEAEAHECRSCEEGERNRLAPDEDAETRADEGSQREVGAGPGGSELSQGADIEYEAHPVAEEPHHRSGGQHGR